MCLAVPGKVIEIRDQEGTVDFQGSRLEVSLLMTPDVKVGGWVLVHAGYAINELDEEEARQTWSYLREAGLVEEALPNGGEADEPGGRLK